ncbi:Hypothetical protein A7982_05922 [Minicystis rosea]|nr:Hypothetical protein A7982_05922 [Minicystis rosea]
MNLAIVRRLEPLAYMGLLLAASLACGNGSKRQEGGSAPGSTPASSEQAIAVDAATLMADYKGNEVRGDAKWKGKLVKVTGLVGHIKKDILDKPFVTLGTGAAFEIPEVQCSLARGQEAKAASLDKGTRATFQGRVSGLMMNVLLDDCELVGGAPTSAAASPAQEATPRPQPQQRPTPKRR